MATIPDAFRDLVSGPGVAILTTNGPDGFPQTTALWFLFDEDGKVKLSLNDHRQKAKNLLRDPRVSLFFIDAQNPYRTLEIRGTATVEPDDDYLFADKVGAHYGGVDLRPNDKPGERRLVVTIEPLKVNTFGR